MKCLYSIVIFALAVCCAHSAQDVNPKIIEVGPKVQFVNRGKTAIFKCVVKNPFNYSVFWNDRNGFIMTIDDRVIIDGERYSVRVQYDFNLALTTYTLSIKNVSEDDVGTYSCQTSNDDLKSKVQLKIKASDTVLLYKSPDKYKEVGEDVTIHCISDKISPESCTWLKKGEFWDDNDVLTHNANKITSNDRISVMYQNSGTFACSLTIKSITKEDNGTYVCQTYHYASNKIYPKINLFVGTVGNVKTAEDAETTETTKIAETTGDAETAATVETTEIAETTSTTKKSKDLFNPFNLWG